ncbi:phage tail tape measure protein [Agrococcus pavilionensis]|uniref:phage tail tape measure protein n=1 Tax=Agrococcus pavilionensis TaxID=1346502 RepID=UPI0003A05F4E|nr:phage tail tape measure protein [Agrococcus pavilionensis]
MADLEVLFTAATEQVEKADKFVRSIGERIEKNPLKVKADAKDALASMDRVEKAAKKLVSADTAIKLDADISRAEATIARAKQRIEDLQVRALGGLDVTADTKRAEAALQKTERQLKALTDAKAMIEVDANTKPTENAFRRVRGAAAETGSDAGDEMGQNLIAALTAIPIAGGLVLLGKAAAETLIDSFREGLAQQAGRDRLEALTGIDEAAAARVARAAGEAYANVFGESIEANMDTGRLALQFDLIDEEATTRSSQRVIEGLAGLADVLGEEVRPVAQSVAVLLQTGVAKSAEEAFDLIATGAREGLNRNEDLLDTLTEYPALFRRLGLSGPQALGLINQAMREGARNSDLAADALKEFQIRSTDASEASAEGYRLLGLNAREMTAQIARGGEDAVAGLDTVLDRLRATEDPVKRNAAAVALFGTMAEDLGESLFAMDLSSAVEELNGVEGAARRMFDTLASNDATAIEQAQRNIEVAADGIKGALAAAFSEPLGNFADWVSRNRGPLTQFLLDLANGALDFGRSGVIAAADTTVAFGQFVAGPLREAMVGLRELIDWLPGDADLTGMDEMIARMESFDDETATAAQTMRDTLIPGIDEAQERLNAWGDPIVQLGYLNDAALRTAEAVSAVGFAADGTALSIEGLDVSNHRASTSGVELEHQVRRSISALAEEIDAAHAAGESQDELASRYRNGTDALVGQMVQMGLTEGQARELIDTVLQTPENRVTTFGSNAVAEQGRVQNLANRITTLPDGSVVITANTSPAQVEIDELWRRNNGRVIRMNVLAGQAGVGAGAGPIAIRQELGGLVEFMASGGLRGLSPMAPIAQVVPANTWRVVGDRSDVAESYIPLDGSARSMAIFLETARRMGVQLMGDGGITARPGVSSSPRELVGRLYLSSGEFIGLVRGVVQESDERDALEVRQGVRG